MAQKPPEHLKQNVTIDWEQWIHGPTNDDDDHDIADIDLDARTLEWYAGADLELAALFGYVGKPDEAHYAGIGMPPREVSAPSGARRRGAPDETGLLGHRLAWAARTIHTALIWFTRLIPEGGSDAARPVLTRPRGGDHDAESMLTPFRSMVYRARAYRRERWLADALRNTEGYDYEEVKCVSAALDLIGMTMLGEIPMNDMLRDWASIVVELLPNSIYRATEEHVAMALASLALRRRRGRLQALRAWAKKATLKKGHAMTKPPEANNVYSASASKTHRGERTQQVAADMGLTGWSEQWLASQIDKGDETAKLVQDIDDKGPSAWHVTEDGVQSIIVLPAINGERIDKVCKKFRGETGISTDNLRPRLVSWLSHGAKTSLAKLLMHIERTKRWPPLLRGTLAIALAKKGGGARLIGLIIALYRIWARLRYEDVQRALESRLGRPFHTAAPGEGAAMAAATASLLGEAAHGRGEASATTMADIEQFYEQISFTELISGAAAFGLPPAVTSLVMHQYAGPRRLRVGQAHSQAVYPTRSVIPGCTWATVLIRMMVIGPAEKFLRAVQQRCTGFDVSINLNIYVDDLAVTTRGFAREAILLHTWVTRLLVQWITQRLHKRLAANKLICIASSPYLRGALENNLGSIGCSVSLEGDLLGADFSAGGLLRRRRGLRKRMCKNGRRRARLRWWRGLGGDAREIARGGIGPSIAFGATASGLPPKAAHLRRRLQGATTYATASGSSLTARLALGGRKYGDSDPSVIDPNPPIIMLLSLLWDRPQLRSEFIDAWRSTAADLAGCAPMAAWRRVRGIVSAAWAHLRQHRAEWTAPFRLRLLGNDVDLVSTPPKQVLEILRAHARWYFDVTLIERIVTEHATEDEASDILHAYRRGIDWKSIREALCTNSGPATALENRALFLLTSKALWPEARRWKAGMTGHGTCTTCMIAIGSQRHRVHECAGVQQHMTWQVIAGKLSPSSPLFAHHHLLPLTLYGLPPLRALWQPVHGRRQDGLLPPQRRGHYYGDGSGVRQESAAHRRATWALYLHDGDIANSLKEVEETTGTLSPEHYIRGMLNGWRPTVPRAETRAIVAFLERALPGSTYHGDCRYALEVAAAGVPARFRSSWSGDADLWRTVKRLLDDAAGKENMKFIKIKAHRGRAAAECEGHEALQHWTGNARVDVLARKLARELREQGRDQETNDPREGTVRHQDVQDALRWLAVSTAWALRHWPEQAVKRRPKQRLAQQGVTTVGPHTLVPRRGGGYICSECHLYTTTQTSMKSLRNTPCRGTLTSACHYSHVLEWSRGVLWCSQCASYTIRRPRALKLPCPGQPKTEAARNVQRRLREGLPPTTADYLTDEVKIGAIVKPNVDKPQMTYAQDGKTPNNAAGAGRPDAASAEGTVPTQVGRYARLDQQRARETTAEAHDAGSLETVAKDEANPNRGARRRLRGKQKPVQAEALAAQPARPTIPLCSPVATAPWTTRVGISSMSVLQPCMVCEGRTRTTCRGCSRALCIACARARRTCPHQSERVHEGSETSRTSDPSSAVDHQLPHFQCVPCGASSPSARAIFSSSSSSPVGPPDPASA